MGKEDFLGQFEQITLLALIRLGENAYGMTIRQEIAKRTGKEVSIGAIYTTLDRLEKKGFVSSRIGEATAERGGRAKRYFKVKAAGATALNRSRETIARMAEGLALEGI